MKVIAINLIREKILKNSQWLIPLAIFLLAISAGIFVLVCDMPTELKSPLAILISALTGATIAIFSIYRNVKVTREKATLDIIQKSESDTYYIDSLTAFQDAVKHPSGIVAFMDISVLKSDELKERSIQRRAVHDFLNHYELVALSISKRVLDEAFYRHWMRGTFVRHYHQAKPYIDERRKVRGELIYSAYADLAEKWDKEIKR